MKNRIKEYLKDKYTFKKLYVDHAVYLLFISVVYLFWRANMNVLRWIDIVICAFPLLFSVITFVYALIRKVRKSYSGQRSDSKRKEL